MKWVESIGGQTQARNPALLLGSFLLLFIPAACLRPSDSLSYSPTVGQTTLVAQTKVVANSGPPASTIPNHMLTWAYDGTYGGQTDGTSRNTTNPTSQRHVQAWVSYAEGNGPTQKELQDCSPGVKTTKCQAVVYFDSNHIFSNSAVDRDVYAVLNSANLPNDSGFYHNVQPVVEDRVTHTTGPCSPRSGPCYWLNSATPQVLQFYSNCLFQGGGGPQCNNSHYIPLPEGTVGFNDTMAGLCRGYFYDGDGAASSRYPVELGAPFECDRNLQANLRNTLNHIVWADLKPVRQFVNSLGAICGSCLRTKDQATWFCTGAGTHALGGVLDSDETSGMHVPTKQVAAIDLDTVAMLFNETTICDAVFLNRSAASAGSGTQLQQRRYHLATIWAGYDQQRTVSWEAMNPRPTILNIYPEEQIVPANPVETMGDMTNSGTKGTGCDGNKIDNTMTGGVHDLVVFCKANLGVYVREFRNCYSWRVLVGRCAVVFNTTNTAVTISSSWAFPSGAAALTKNYGHSLEITGSDVVTDGCSDTTGCATGSGTDLNFKGNPFVINSSEAPADDALFLFS